MHTIIYEYGARLDKDCLSATEDQFNKARALYNNCIEIIIKARNEADQFIRQNDPAIAAKMVEIESLNTQFDAAKAINAEPKMKEIAGLRREAWKELTPMMKVARNVHREKLSEIFSVIGLKKACLTYQARCNAVADGLGSATADDIHATALRAWDKVRKDGGRLNFRSALRRQQDHIINRFTVRGGVPIDNLLTKPHNMIGLIPPAEIKRKRYGDFNFRVGSAKAKLNAMGTWQYHRPFPENSKVTTIRLIRKKIGPSIRWALQFQLSIPELPKVKRTGNEQLCAIHLGFNLADSGKTRIGAITDCEDPGFAKMIDLPEDITRNLTRVEKIQKRRCENRDTIHTLFKTMAPDLGDELNKEWEAIRKLPAQQVAIERIKILSRKMERLGVGGEAAAILKAYTINDHWLYAQERHLHRKTLNRRKNFYRQLAINLARQYRVIAIGRYDLSKMALRIDENGERNELGQIARRSQHAAALFQLISCIDWACVRTGSAMVEDKDLEYASQCAGCGAIAERNSDLFNCECGAESDIKANAASTLYSRWSDKKAIEKANKLFYERFERHADYMNRKSEKLMRMQSKRKAVNAIQQVG